MHNSLWITFPTQPCFVLYFFWASLLLQLTVSSLSPQKMFNSLFFSAWEIQFQSSFSQNHSCIYLIKLVRHFVSTYSIFDQFKSPYGFIFRWNEFRKALYVSQAFLPPIEALLRGSEYSNDNTISSYIYLFKST